MSEIDQKNALSENVKQAIHAGRKVDAIKALRMERNIGLKEAKDIVDNYVFNNPSLFPQAAPTDGSGIGKILLIIIIVFGTYFLFKEFA